MIVLLCAAVTFSCYGFEPGFYSSQVNSNQDRELMKIQAQADRSLFCQYENSLLKFDLGLGPVRGGAKYTIYFSKEDLVEFLEAERHKQLLVVTCDAMSIMWYHDAEGQRRLKEIEDFVTRFKYDRILILGAHAVGRIVVKDIVKNNSKSKPPLFEKPPVKTETK